MRVLIIGPSGSGKTYLCRYFREHGFPAEDIDEMPEISSWYEGEKKIAFPENADKEFMDSHEFLWDRSALEKVLQYHSDIYLFGSSGNMFTMLDLFDKVFFLNIPPHIQEERLTHPSRSNPMGNNPDQRSIAISWGKEIAEQARQRNISFIDATLLPEEILTIITK